MKRRDFLKAGAASIAVSGLSACTPKVTNTDNSLEISGSMAQNFPGTSLLGYGCMRWPLKDGAIDQEEVNRLVDYALEHGVNYFDTAPAYSGGKNELATSIALNRHPRDKWILATKLSNYRDFSYDFAVNMYRESLRIFQTDYIDYYLLHNLSGIKAFNDRFAHIMDFLLAEREAGHIRHLGFSFHGSNKGFDELMALHDKYHWDFVQIQMNYLDWEINDAKYLYEELAKRNIPITIMEPLRGGQLATIPASLADKLKAREPQRSIASWAFRFAGSYPQILTVLSGMTYMDHLQDNLRSYSDFQPLGEEDKALLLDIARRISQYPLVRCTDCQYCMPCPYGIDISGVFKFYNANVNAATYVESKEQEGYERLRLRYLRNYDKAVQGDRQADHCIACGECVSKCPQRIAIPRELRRIDKYVESLRREEL